MSDKLMAAVIAVTIVLLALGAFMFIESRKGTTTVTAVERTVEPNVPPIPPSRPVTTVDPNTDPIALSRPYRSGDLGYLLPGTVLEFWIPPNRRVNFEVANFLCPYSEQWSDLGVSYRRKSTKTEWHFRPQNPLKQFVHLEILSSGERRGATTCDRKK